MADRNREPTEPCKLCLGTGDRYVPTPDGKMMQKVDCTRCKGLGKVVKNVGRVSRSW